jgi:SWI/SNF-related matrix-associated actin-dependent regulator of chromatin subfamily A member 5
MHAPNQEEQTRQRQHLFEHATKYDVVLTTYEMVKVPPLLNFYQRTKFHYLVLDEGHKIKSHVTQISKAMRKIHTGNRLLLTGTPLQNNLVELWSLMNFLYPEVFTVCDPFEQHFDLKENIVDKAFLGKTQKMLALFMLRRLKQEVEKLIPEKLETKVYCPLSKVQTFWYKATLMKDVVGLAKMEGKGGVKVNSQKNLNVLRNLFMQLRKCSNHPFLFDGAEVNPEETSLEDLIGASGKLSVLDMLLRSLFQKGHRAVVFTQFTMLLDLIEDYCILRGWKYCRLDGATDRARRNFLLRRFNEPNSQYFLFLMSTKSGGMGLNLQTADTCILFDSDWNPQSDIQAMARVHRIGQRKKVHVYRLVTSGTIEERILERAEKKLLLEIVNRETQSNTTMDLEDPNATARGLSAGELLEDIKFGCEAIFGNSSNNELPSEEDIAVITDRARKESRSVGKLTGGTAKSSNSFNATKNFTQSQVFGGVDFQQVRKQKENELIPKNLKGIAYLWHEIKSLENKKRERKSRICQVEGKGTGYGKEYVPVLTANNYTFCGETSVFDRELKQSNKSNFEVKKRKNKGPSFENTDHCVVCGDGGDLVCCPICPNTVHLSCVGLCRSNDFQSCPHHRCSKCNKNRYHAGGLLYSCNSCPNSYCEDCLPKEGVTFLDKLERFEKLGFDSTKRNVYIHCSDMCENYAVAELGYHPPNLPCEKKRASCPKAIDLSDHFGTSYDLKEAAAAVIAHKEDTVGRGKRNIARKNFDLEKGPTKKSSNAFNGTVEAADNTVFAEAIVISTANAATPGKPNYFVNDSMTPTSKRSQEQQTAMSKTNDTPSTSATEVSSDAYSYCVEVDVATPAATLAGRDARHAIKID